MHTSVLWIGCLAHLGGCAICTLLGGDGEAALAAAGVLAFLALANTKESK